MVWIEKNKIQILIILALLVVGLAGSIVYLLCGHQLLERMYEGRSLAILNKVIAGQAVFPLAYYLEGADRLFLGLGVFYCLIILLVFFSTFGISKFFRYALLTSALFYSAFYLVASVLRIAYPFELEWIEGISDRKSVV